MGYINDPHWYLTQATDLSIIVGQPSALGKESNRSGQIRHPFNVTRKYSVGYVPWRWWWKGCGDKMPRW